MVNYWEREAVRLIQAERARKGLEWAELVDILNEHSLPTESTTVKALTNRINRGNFPFHLALKLLSALGVSDLEIPKQPLAPGGKKK